MALEPAEQIAFSRIDGPDVGEEIRMPSQDRARRKGIDEAIDQNGALLLGLGHSIGDPPHLDAGEPRDDDPPGRCNGGGLTCFHRLTPIFYYRHGLWLSRF